MKKWKKVKEEIKLGLARCCEVGCKNCPFELLDPKGPSCEAIVCRYDSDISLFDILGKMEFSLERKSHRMVYDMLNACLCDEIVEIEKEVLIDENN